MDERSTSTRTAAATEARMRTRLDRQAIEVCDRIELLSDTVLTEMGRVLIEELDRRKAGAA